MIFVRVPKLQKDFRNFIQGFAEALDRSEIEVVKIDYKNCIIHTPNVTVQFITSDMKLEGLRCDEAFGFSPGITAYLRRKQTSKMYPRPIINYILEQEALNKQSL